jgi:mycofactocin precursor
MQKTYQHPFLLTISANIVATPHQPPDPLSRHQTKGNLMSTETISAEGPVVSEQAEAQSATVQAAEEAVTADALIEEVSIDGMCGVY